MNYFRTALLLAALTGFFLVVGFDVGLPKREAEVADAEEIPLRPVEEVQRRSRRRTARSV